MGILTVRQQMEPQDWCRESLGNTDVEELPNLEEGRRRPHAAFTNVNERRVLSVAWELVMRKRKRKKRQKRKNEQKRALWEIRKRIYKIEKERKMKIEPKRNYERKKNQRRIISQKKIK
ncbi:hypothetical protein E2C01_067682 [Portunus trituberculatus]|uniref:Uncharacterized protein n=1 Tax=Portunus trituberculatus TaxID=210409 RepID=A0A5B7HUF4_PORTR|nr:hypothetical protein [Portunus trituberculatus]